MATPFREMSWPIQALAFLGLAIILVLAGLYLPLSPVRTERVAVDDANAQLEPLKKEVQTLQVYQQRRVELQGEMEALQKQLATLQAIVPENKEIDQFIIMVQGAASGAGVSIRKIATLPVVAKQYHYEMPVTVTADGPYFSVMDFFARLARLSRIINVGDVKMEEVKDTAGGGSTFRMSPGTTVTGSFSITTYFTESADETATNAQTSAATPVKH
ncbi:MAG TPA: type 4a pilus biogenesis protein PilO [Candidatus Acidoferrales bacterium]|nr:type 4a pilus biogenesis protein PilO [Candidatus Acidoferrales bacterium]